MNSLPVQIYNDVTSPTTAVVNRAWGAALALVTMILLLNLVARPGLAQEPPRMSGDAIPSQTANVEPANVDPESRTESKRERIAPNASPTDGATGQRRGAGRRHAAPRRRAGVSVTLQQLRAFYGDAEQVKGIDLEFRAKRGHGDHRALGLWQVDDGALLQPDARGDPRRPRRGQRAARRRRRVRPRRRRGRRSPRDRDGLSEAETRSRRCRCSTTSPRACASRRARAREAARPSCTRRSSRRCAQRGYGTRSPIGSPSPGQGFRAASSSGCASPARSPSSLR